MEKTMSQRVQNLLLAGFVALGIMAVCPAQQNQSSGGEANARTKAQAKEPSKQQSQQKEAEPPEEDDSAKPTEYAFNPLQAEKELKVGEFYLKKGTYGAAVARFTEATKWNPTLAEAYLKLGEAEEKYKNLKAAKEAYTKYLELAPDAKNAPEIKKKLLKM
jgi:tetratricopeptide (TPR) repeat protein